jgi:hemolysin III
MMHPMHTRALSKDGSVHVTDEVWNTRIAGCGALLSVMGTSVLLLQAFLTHPPLHVFAFGLYGLSLVGMFVASALHHGVDGSARTEHLLRQLDYFAIFVLIAGSFTPFAIITLPHTLGWVSLAVMWTVAVVGIAVKAIKPDVPRKWIVTCYLAMSWVGGIGFYNFSQAAPWQALAGIGLCGLFYTGGALIYVLEKPNPIPGRFGFHEIWHVCVLFGSAALYSVILQLL